MAQSLWDMNNKTASSECGLEKSLNTHAPVLNRSHKTSENELDIESSQIGFKLNTETGQSTTLHSNVVDFPVSMFGNRDLMSIIMSRQVGGHSSSKDTEGKTGVKKTSADIDAVTKSASLPIDTKSVVNKTGNGSDSKTVMNDTGLEMDAETEVIKTSDDIDTGKVVQTLRSGIDTEKIVEETDLEIDTRLVVNKNERDIDAEAVVADNETTTVAQSSGRHKEVIESQEEENESVKTSIEAEVSVTLEQHFADETNNSESAMSDDDIVQASKGVHRDNDNDVNFINGNEVDTERSFREINMDLDLLNGCLEPSEGFGVVKSKSISKDNERKEENHCYNEKDKRLDGNQNDTKVGKEFIGRNKLVNEVDIDMKETRNDYGEDEKGIEIPVSLESENLGKTDCTKLTEDNGNFILNEHTSDSIKDTNEDVKIKHISEESSFNTSHHKVENIMQISEAQFNDSDEGKNTGFEADKKKSRKQNAPRRISHISNSLISKVMEKQEEKKTCSDEDGEIVRDTVKEHAKLDEIIKAKSEKSRKQNAPKRIANSDYDLFGKVLKLRENEDDDVNEDYEDGVLTNQKVETTRKPKEQTYIETNNGHDFNMENVVVKIENVETGDSYNSDGSNVNDNYQNSFLNSETGNKNFTYTNSDLQYGRNDSLTFQYGKEKNLDFSPFHNEMLETLSKSSIQNGNAENEQISLGNIEENLDVVRKLREIRYYKYRKITMTEKQEIASYAKQYGVSSAAIQFGVSKSAVSMWTRIDLTNAKNEARKKNCMLGNEKFELLLERVKAEKANKFKGLAKQDKYEVSRYAKLVGVREMARCLDIALGTVSGWMRQFPYTVKSTNQDEDSSDLSNEMNLNQDNLSQESQDTITECRTPEQSNEELDSSTSQANNEGSIAIKVERVDYSYEEGAGMEPIDYDTRISEEDGKKKVDDEIEDDYYKNSGENESIADTKEYNVNKSHKKHKRKQSAAGHRSEKGDASGGVKKRKKDSSPEINTEEEKTDEVDSMIAETLVAPDIDKLLEDLKNNIKDTILENDDFFENLFKRVVSCKADKYKTLKASEKIEVVRYAKRVGVRRVAKLLGLATGTLSGWNTKYQQLLGLTMDGGPQMEDYSLNVPSSSVGIDDKLSGLSSDNQDNVSSIPTSSFAVLDNAEKSEVTAIKFLLKEQYQVLRTKIEIAKQVKFRNMSTSEKIDVVKCAKLVGIRPTARVLGMPIGTLSGWITKYTGTLHPVYHVDDPEPLGSKPLYNKEGLSVSPSLFSSNSLNSDISATSTSLLDSNSTSTVQSSSTSADDHIKQNEIANFRLPNFSHALMTNLNSDMTLNTSTIDSVNSAISQRDAVNDTTNTEAYGHSIFEGMPYRGFSLSTVNQGAGNDVESFADKEASKMADHYVRMFQESQRLKFS